MLAAPSQSDRAHGKISPVVLYLWVNIGLGAAALFWGALNWHCGDPFRFAAFLATAVAASVLKVRLPGVTGVASVNALFILICIVNLSLSETLVIGAVSIFVQCICNVRVRPKPIQVSFNVCVVAIAIFISAHVYSYARQTSELAALGLLTAAYFIANTLPIVD